MTLCRSSEPVQLQGSDTGEMRFGPVARGLLSYVPALNDVLPSKTGGHTDSAPYCYGVWMKHLTLLHANGFPGVPQTIAELGPGESLGVGLCALLSGVESLRRARRHRAFQSREQSAHPE